MTEELADAELPVPPEDDPNRELTASEIRQWKRDLFEVLFSMHGELHDLRAALRETARPKAKPKAGQAVRRKR
jgi:hypothetical protein